MAGGAGLTAAAHGTLKAAFLKAALQTPPEIFRTEALPENFKKRLKQIGLHQRPEEQADGVLVRDLIRLRQAAKPVETAGSRI